MTDRKADGAETRSRRICELCDVEMTPLEAQFNYLNRTFKHVVLRCPRCGQVYIPEELAEGRMREVEKTLEEK
ncbi:MAG: hypothetical protein LBO81_06060 [Clostridiales Family XIII bacterium]|jgi:uncharacterized protein with PIN domain|nr:hypothetical protein [Clostridiales Family XIII bacterium]